MAKKKSEGSAQAGGEAVPAKPYVVLARKYRPQTFDDLIGQETMVQTLRNAFAAGRIAHGFMLTGVRGVGKTTTARILARALNYETDTIAQPTIDMPAPGRHCVEIMESRHPDVVEMDAASNTGVDNIREIIESARYRPLAARTKVFIIDEVHMLSKGAFNALLKTLEEPPGHVKFIFATTEVRKVPVTVLSRCQRFDLRRVDVPRLVQHLRNIVAGEGATADDDALTLIARAAEGSVRDALSILDQAIATALGPQPGEADTVGAEAVRALLGLADRGRIFDLLETLAAGDIATALKALDGLIHDGADAAQVLADLAEAVHITARIKAVGPEPAGEGLALAEKQRAGALGERLSMGLLSRLWQMLLKGLDEAGKAPNPAAAAQMVLIRIAHTADLPPPDEVIRALGGAPEPRRNPAAPAPSQASATPVATRSDAPVATDETPEDGGDDDRFTFEGLDELEPADGSEDAAGSVQGVPLRALNTFADIVALAGDKRDAKLMIALEDQVSLVRFDGASGAIDLFLLPGAPAGLANDLREKLNKWTGRRWVIMLSKTPGEQPLGEVRREREAREIASLKSHPAVAAVLEEFPDAEISAVRPLDAIRDDDSAAG